MATIVLEHISKSFNREGSLFEKQAVLADINLTLPNGRVSVILGPSGCGKTTLLKIVAGLVRADQGEIYFSGQAMSTVPPKERRLGMVFQDFALYPNWYVKDNILSYFKFRPKTQELSQEAEEKYARTSELMGVELGYLLDRKPKNLSPGEKQRVAMARCITRDPVLFLLDEPFSHLDQHLREKYRTNLKRLLHEFKITTLYVTHDQNEALILADDIVMMRAGKVEQVGSYNDLHYKPRNLFVASFLNPNPIAPALNVLKGEWLAPDFAGKLIGIRPQDLSLEPEGCRYGLELNLNSRYDLPALPMTLLTTEFQGETIYAYVPHPNRQVPERLRLGISKFMIFNAQTELTEGHYP
ncbi:MAG: ABC transporter ATP-binding protein [Trueperaceae bacterium]|nr:ABC transporter ATP-binding protein [Trueperaceae bacterium]